ncbi:WhiB family transcriptional regulator [Streptomyces acidiscabies]|uniref:WhiB family transcriptional regulator n=1 Tax=Streptomyces acidiscabies TaxID=42234 RepID=UPI000950BC2E|nr:WhiB family transcriptional regulator [Streptomyces acidiscabies]
MTRITVAAAVPDTLGRAPDWRLNAACRQLADPDDMFPNQNAVAIKAARDVCAPCPVWAACLRGAIRTRDDEWGVRAGLRPEERRKVAKLVPGARLDDPVAPAAAIQRVLHPHTATRTLPEVWEEHSHTLPDGHLGWRGSGAALYVGGVSYTPAQISYILDRGHRPYGMVRRTCTVDGCVHPQHLTDATERHLARRNAT